VAVVLPKRLLLSSSLLAPLGFTDSENSRRLFAQKKRSSALDDKRILIDVRRRSTRRANKPKTGFVYTAQSACRRLALRDMIQGQHLDINNRRSDDKTFFVTL